MKYESTRGSRLLQGSASAIIKGIAEDRGLYVPAEIPALPFSAEEIKDLPYKDVAFSIMRSYFDEYTEEEMRRCVNGAYDKKFDTSEIVPVVKKGGAWFLELYHGKTAAFKDMALSILPYLMTEACKKENVTDRICILTATSGDTGKAALEGFAGVDGTEIIVFYPQSGVSRVQEKQMVSQEGKNTHVYAIKGNFDDAQTGVKRIFADEKISKALAEKHVRFSSANSINIGRLVPQIAYYVYGYARLVRDGALKDGEPMNVAVPTGNFGNILAAYMAKLMGLPIGKLICASNENKVLTDFIRTGVYDARREFHLTNSPSMDILISSNLERLLYLLSGRDGSLIKELMANLDSHKHYEVTGAIKEGLKDFYGGFCTQQETLDTIGEMWKENGYLIDTHTAVAYKVYRDYAKETGDDRPTLIASTASAYKFAESVAGALGLDAGKVRILAGAEGEPSGFDYVKALAVETGVKVPEGLRDLESKPVLHTGVCDADAMAQAVRESLF